jgi:xanthine dehydrogenase accessory factor
MKKLTELLVLVRGAGEMASGVAWRLYQSRFKLLLTEVPQPLAVRREVSFCEAVYEGRKKVEGVEAVLVRSPDNLASAWKSLQIPLLIDPALSCLQVLQPDVLVDAILAKKNLGTQLKQAPLVVALGPGFKAGQDAHLVIETNRGHNLGRILTEGEAEANTGVPGMIGGYAKERVLRSPGQGRVAGLKTIGDTVTRGEIVARVEVAPVQAEISGVVRGLIRDGTPVPQGLKIGDIDPRGNRGYCFTISEKARAIAGAVLEGILRTYNR